MVLQVLEDVRHFKVASGETMYVVKDVCNAVGINTYLSILRRNPGIYRELVDMKDYGGTKYQVNVTNLAGALTIILRHGKDSYARDFELFAKLLKKEGLA